MTPEERIRLRRQLSEQAVKLAVSNRWDEAAAANREFIRMFGEDADALNRLGKALSEIGQIAEARGAYSRALEIDPTNTIARRNVDRLAGQEAAGGPSRSQLDTRFFLQESGKAAIATLQAVDDVQVTRLDPGDVVAIDVQGNAVNVVTQDGEYIGMVEPRIALRLSKLAAGGNRYSAAMVTTMGEVKVTLRETYQHPSQAEIVSFPQARASDFRAYTRRGLLRGEEMDFSEDDDEAPDDEDERDGWTEEDEDGEPATVDVNIETEDESFD
jgi:tetratricopeptide (TPR) repeat protein